MPGDGVQGQAANEIEEMFSAGREQFGCFLQGGKFKRIQRDWRQFLGYFGEL